MELVTNLKERHQ